MSIEDTDTEDEELQPADSIRNEDGETKGILRPGGAVPLTQPIWKFAETDIDEDDSDELDFDDADFTDPNYSDSFASSPWLLRLVELLLATAILFLFL